MGLINFRKKRKINTIVRWKEQWIQKFKKREKERDEENCGLNKNRESWVWKLGLWKLLVKQNWFD